MTLDSIPLCDDCILHIMQYLNTFDKLSFGCVNKQVFGILSTHIKGQNVMLKWKKSTSEIFVGRLMKLYAEMPQKMTIVAKQDYKHYINFYNLIEIFEEKFRALVGLDFYENIFKHILPTIESLTLKIVMLDLNTVFDGYFDSGTDPGQMKQAVVACYVSVVGQIAHAISTIRMNNIVNILFQLEICCDRAIFNVLINSYFDEIMERIDGVNWKLFMILQRGNMHFEHEVFPAISCFSFNLQVQL